MKKTILIMLLGLAMLLAGCTLDGVFINSFSQPTTGEVGLIEVTAEVEMNSSTGQTSEGFLGVYIPTNGDYSFVNATCTGSNGTNFIFRSDLTLTGPRNVTYDQLINLSTGGNVYSWEEPDTSINSIQNGTAMCEEKVDYTYYVIWTDVTNTNNAVWQCTLYLEFFEEGDYSVDYFIGYAGGFGANVITDTACDNSITIGDGEASSRVIPIGTNVGKGVDVIKSTSTEEVEPEEEAPEPVEKCGFQCWLQKFIDFVKRGLI